MVECKCQDFVLFCDVCTLKIVPSRNKHLRSSLHSFSTLSQTIVSVDMLLVQAFPSFRAAVLSSHMMCDIPFSNSDNHFCIDGCITNPSSYTTYCPRCPFTEITASQSPR